MSSARFRARLERGVLLRLPILAAAGTGVQVGAAMVATRSVVDDIDPVSLTFLRYLIGAGLLVPIARRTTRIGVERRHIPIVAVIGLVQFGLLVVLLNMGLRSVPAAQGAIIFAMSPLLALALGIVMGQERLSVRKVTGIFVALTGLAIVLGPDVVRSSDRLSITGELLVLGSAACAAVASVWSRPYVRRYGALPVSALAMIATVLVLILPALAAGLLGQVANATMNRAGAIIFLGISSGVGYIMWLYALKTVTASTVTTFLMLGPVTALVAGAFLLDEPVTSAAVLGMAVLGVGLWVTSRERVAAVTFCNREGCRDQLNS